MKVLCGFGCVQCESHRQHTNWIVFGELLIVCLWCVFLPHSQQNEFRSFVSIISFGFECFCLLLQNVELWGWQNDCSQHLPERLFYLFTLQFPTLCCRPTDTHKKRKLSFALDWMQMITHHHNIHTCIFYFCLFIQLFRLLFCNIYFRSASHLSMPIRRFHLTQPIFLTHTNVNKMGTTTLHIVNNRQSRNLRLTHAHNVRLQQQHVRFQHTHIGFHLSEGLFLWFVVRVRITSNLFTICYYHYYYYILELFVPIVCVKCHFRASIVSAPRCLTSPISHLRGSSVFSTFHHSIVIFISLFILAAAHTTLGSTNIFDDCQTKTFNVNISVRFFFGWKKLTKKTWFKE